MFTRNFGTGFIGRTFTAVLEVIVIAIALIIVGAVLAALNFVVPAIIVSLVKIALVVYFLGRVFGFFGPSA